MSLILYSANETAFDSNGLGILSDAIDDEVYEELNGRFELTVQYPVDGIHFRDIVADAYITARPNPETAAQPFRIYRISKPMRGVVTIYARHMAYRNKKIVVAPFSAGSALGALQGLKNNAVNACPFNFWTDIVSVSEMKVEVPTDLWTLLGSEEGSILDVYGGEYEFDRFDVRLWNRRGTDRGVSIRYGKNLTDLKQDENIANVYTGVCPFWSDGKGSVVMLPERIVSGPGVHAEAKIMPLDLSQAFEEPPSEAMLRDAALDYIAGNDIGKPEVSWTIEFVQLEQTEEYKGSGILERILIGDTVNVVFPKLDIDVSARAVAVRYKPTLQRYKSITLGAVKQNLAHTIAWQQQELDRARKPSLLRSAAERATSWLSNGKGILNALRDTDGSWRGISGRLASLAGGGYFDLNSGVFGSEGRPTARVATMKGIRILNGELYGLVYDGVDEASMTEVFRLWHDDTGVWISDGRDIPSGVPFRIWSTGGLRLGDPAGSAELVGTEVAITGDSLIINGKRMIWKENTAEGYAYLVGVDEVTE